MQLNFASILIKQKMSELGKFKESEFKIIDRMVLINIDQVQRRPHKSRK